MNTESNSQMDVNCCHNKRISENKLKISLPTKQIGESLWQIKSLMRELIYFVYFTIVNGRRGEDMVHATLHIASEAQTRIQPTDGTNIDPIVHLYVR